MATQKKLEAQLDRYSRLLAAFGGDVAGWEFTDVVDCGSMGGTRCPCGCQIRYKCIWTHSDGRTTHTGNVCVHTIPALSQVQIGRMEDALAALLEKQKEIEKRKKLDALASVVEQLTVKLNGLKEIADIQMADIRYNYGYGWLPDDIYSESWKLRCLLETINEAINGGKKLRTARGQRDRLAKAIETVERSLKGQQNV